MMGSDPFQKSPFLPSIFVSHGLLDARGYSDKGVVVGGGCIKRSTVGICVSSVKKNWLVETVMPIDARKSHGNIVRELIRKYKRHGKIGNIRPGSMREALKIANAIAYSVKRGKKRKNGGTGRKRQRS